MILTKKNLLKAPSIYDERIKIWLMVPDVHDVGAASDDLPQLVGLLLVDNPIWEICIFDQFDIFQVPRTWP